MRSLVSSPYVRRLSVAALLVIVVLGISYFSWVSRTQAAPQQPLPFPHAKMVQAGVQCVFCHTTAQSSPAAGIPSVEKCMGCHRVIANQQPAIKTLAGYWERQQPVQWVRVVQMPSFVHFSHEAHIAAGLNCERCHGDVGQMQVTHQVTNMNMGWCISCHQQQPNADQLRDCSICHY